MSHTKANDALLKHIAKMNNVKNELLAHVGGMDNVKAVQFIHLPEGYSEEVLADFLRKIDFAYDDPCGWQQLVGFIWWKDGTWSSRYTYDGKEWWVHNEAPTYPLSRKEMMELR